MKFLKLFVASDHAGVVLKEEIVRRLDERGIEVIDFSSDEDYPDVAYHVVRALLRDDGSYGILFCGTGIGMSIAANRYFGIRAASCHDTTSVRLACEHNNINVLTLGARLVGCEVGWDCVRTFLETWFSEEERHQRRVAKLDREFERQRS